DAARTVVFLFEEDVLLVLVEDLVALRDGWGLFRRLLLALLHLRRTGLVLQVGLARRGRRVRGGCGRRRARGRGRGGPRVGGRLGGRVPKLATDDGQDGQDVEEPVHVSTVPGSGRCDQSETVNAIAVPALQRGSRCNCRMHMTNTLVTRRPPLAISRS